MAIVRTAIVIVIMAAAELFTEVQCDRFTENCRRCICHVEGCQGQIGKCRWDVGSYSCGPYQIKNEYYIDCYRPGGDWRSCTKQMACSEGCVDAYMQRYGTYCTPNPTCRDYARMHNGGPHGCRRHADPWAERNLAIYWDKVSRCCRSIGGC